MMKYVAEFLGTFVFLSVILAVTQRPSEVTPVMVAAGLLAAVLLVGSVSGAHLNPAVSVMMAFNKSLPTGDLVPYIGAQLLGGIAAKVVFDMMNRK
jgi:aquaporin Z